MKLHLKKLLIAFVLTFSTATIGGLVTAQAIPIWYESLNKPFFNPPNWIFGPVWMLLYGLMAIALYLVWNSKMMPEKASHTKRNAYIFFGIQLVLNLLWSVTFFGFRQPLIAFFVIVSLWIFILLTMWQFRKFSLTAGFLFLPYALWVSFASILNAYIVKLN